MEDKSMEKKVKGGGRIRLLKPSVRDRHKDLAGLKLLVTVVGREKAEFYIDFLHQ